MTAATLPSRPHPSHAHGVLGRWLRRQAHAHRHALAVGAVAAVSLLSGYVHVLHRAVADGPQHQQEMLSDHEGRMQPVSSLADDDGDVLASGGAIDDDHDPTRNRLFDTFIVSRTAQAAITL